MTETRKVKRGWLIPVMIAAAFLLLLLAAREYFRLPVLDYYRASEKSFRIPGLNNGFVPQGLSYDADADLFFVTGYQKDGTASPVYTVSPADGTVNRTPLLNADGTAFTGHAGGLSVHGDYVYVAGGEDNCVYVFSRSGILSAPEEGVPCLGSVETALPDGDGIHAAFTTVHDGKLYVGEFYREPNYPTPESHKITTRVGDRNTALALAYEFTVDADNRFGLAPVPCAAYSLPGLVQGMCFDEGTVYLSTSYGLAFSHIYAYDTSALASEGMIADVPLYAMDSASLTDTLQLPPMSEEIEVLDGRLYTMCESASQKYLFGKLTGGAWCYSTPIADN